MIVVTGASRGLGRAMAERLAARGHGVVGLARHVEGLPFPSLACDVSQADQVKAAAQAIKRMNGPVQALINAAGIASMNLALTTPSRTAQQIIDTNLLGTIYCCQMIAPLIIRQRAGSIVNFSTIAVPLGLKGESVYVASKAGVEGFSRAFAREMADFGVTVNCISPGPIGTDLIQGVAPDKIAHVVEQQILRRPMTSNDVCDVVELLLDAKSRTLTGMVFHLGGA